MKMKFLSTVVFCLIIGFTVFGQTQSDTIFNFKSLTPVVIDGQASEACWQNGEWHNIDQVWIPYNTRMKQGDFEGKFKVSWDEDYLYVLVEVVDDSLSDDHANPIQEWWNDDCLEVFIDENRSMGDHEKNCNAFAYHVSLFYDAVDLNASGQGVNYKDNIEVDMDTIGANTYLWEFAIKNYDASFNMNNPEASRVYLSHNKLMGFAIAYCDNDETTARENFIGSMKMTSAHYNDMYKNADYFGPMLLQDPDSIRTGIAYQPENAEIKIYPVPAHNTITIEIPAQLQIPKMVSLVNVTGQEVQKVVFNKRKANMNLEGLLPGMYFIRLLVENKMITRKIYKQ